MECLAINAWIYYATRVGIYYATRSGVSVKEKALLSYEVVVQMSAAEVSSGIQRKYLRRLRKQRKLAAQVAEVTCGSSGKIW